MTAALLSIVLSNVLISGGLACLALAIFQGIATPVAGIIASSWLTMP